jgi:Uma2 family endonuclease
MTVTDTSPVKPAHRGDAWTIEDIVDLPYDGYRYELFDGSLVVTPPPKVPHAGAAGLLNRILDRAAPDDLFVTTSGPGVKMGPDSCYVPDLVVIDRAALKMFDLVLEPSVVHLVVEVLSRGTARRDKGIKWEDYATVGIPNYWILDTVKQTMTVYRLADAEARYVEAAVLAPGEVWKTEQPFPVTVDLGEIF